MYKSGYVTIRERSRTSTFVLCCGHAGRKEEPARRRSGEEGRQDWRCQPLERRLRGRTEPHPARGGDEALGRKEEGDGLERHGAADLARGGRGLGGSLAGCMMSPLHEH